MVLEGELGIFSGTANPELAKKIIEYLGISLGEMEISFFSDGETYVKIKENVRGKDIFLVQSTCPPVNESLMELLIMLDAFRRASARRITVVVPYYGYARQDRKDEPRVPITAKLVANLISTAGADRVLLLDLHVDQIQGFFDIKVDHLFSAPIIIDYLRSKLLENLVILAPDVGGVRRARAYARRLKVPLAIIDKRRPAVDKAEVLSVIGEVKNKDIFIVDDIIDTGGTLLAAVEELIKGGVRKVYAGCTHAVLSAGVYEEVEKSSLTQLIVTDSIPLRKGEPSSKIKVLTVAPLLGEAIKRIHENRSVSSLFS